MKSFLLSFVLCLICTLSIAQKRFPLRAQHTPNGIPCTVELNNGNILSFVKVKGSPQSKKSTYTMVCMNPQLQEIWARKIKFPKGESWTNWSFTNDGVNVFTTVYDLEEHETKLLRYFYETNEGHWVKTDTLNQRKVGEWKEVFGKAKQFQTFQNAIASVSSASYLVPLEYQYKVTFSPNNQKTLVYHYIYSEEKLYAHGIVYDDSMKKESEGKIFQDANYVNYPFLLNNRGDIILNKVTNSGKVGLVQYNLVTKDERYLSFAASNSKRANLSVKMINDDEGYLITLNKKEGRYTGITCAKFDFRKTGDTERTFNLFDVEYKNKIRAAQKKQGLRVDYEWYNYKMLGVDTNDLGDLVVVTEQQLISGERYQYTDDIHEKIEDWVGYRASKIKTATVLVWVLDKELKVKHRYFVAKKQEANTVDGLNTISTSFAVIKNQLHLAYVVSPNEIMYNEIHYISIDKNGQELSNEVIENPMKLVLMRTASLWTKEGDWLWVGRKGLLGRKSFIQRKKYVSKN
ncbi:MAG: hypothetical protein GY827_09580 [Cytophagales bacterium]|nr:hypothetical protein [Cytophagales bacterium]